VQHRPNSGASPSGSGSRPSGQASDAVLSVPASILSADLVEQLRGRARFLRSLANPRVKSPGLMEEAADLIESLTSRLDSAIEQTDALLAKIGGDA
jgi:hypothetical protein